MEVDVIKEDKDLIEVKIIGEGHTLCNLIRQELSDSEGVSFSSYNLKHPLVSSPILSLKVEKGKPRKILLDAVVSLKTKTKHLKSLLNKFS